MNITRQRKANGKATVIIDGLQITPSVFHTLKEEASKQGISTYSMLNEALRKMACELNGNTYMDFNSRRDLEAKTEKVQVQSL